MIEIKSSNQLQKKGKKKRKRKSKISENCCNRKALFHDFPPKKCHLYEFEGKYLEQMTTRKKTVHIQKCK